MATGSSVDTTLCYEVLLCVDYFSGFDFKNEMRWETVAITNFVPMNKEEKRGREFVFNNKANTTLLEGINPFVIEI